MTRQRQSIFALTAIAFALIGTTLAATPSLADIIGGAFTITATNAAGDVATVTIAVPDGATGFNWSSHDMVEMRSEATGDLIAVLNPDGRESSVEYIDDPVVNLAFAVQAGAAVTNFAISSALLSFAPLTAEGRATAGFSVTDGDGDGATMTGVGDPMGAMGAYLAQYNGFAGTLSGTTFAEVIPGITAGVWSTNTASADVPAVGFTSIPGSVNDMSVLISFSLTANDLASGTSSYIIRQRPVPVESSTWSAIKNLY